jgi:hypothetical protein
MLKNLIMYNSTAHKISQIGHTVQLAMWTVYSARNDCTRIVLPRDRETSLAIAKIQGCTLFFTLLNTMYLNKKDSTKNHFKYTNLVV